MAIKWIVEKTITIDDQAGKTYGNCTLRVGQRIETLCKGGPRGPVAEILEILSEQGSVLLALEKPTPHRSQSRELIEIISDFSEDVHAKGFHPRMAGFHPCLCATGLSSPTGGWIGDIAYTILDEIITMPVEIGLKAQYEQFLEHSPTFKCEAFDKAIAYSQPRPVHVFSMDILRDRVRGAVIGGAIGDALGRAVESMNPPTAINEYHKWYGWKSGPVGTVTDDTQLTMWLVESLVQHQGLHPADVIQRFCSQKIRGIGRATRDFVENVKKHHLPWWKAGVNSAGNGAAMRAAPIGMFYAQRPQERVTAAILQAVLTHNHPMAAASSVLVANAVADLIFMPNDSLDSFADRKAFCAHLANSIEGMEGQGLEKRNRSGRDTIERRVREAIPRLLDHKATPEQANHEFWSGAFVLETLPFSLFVFLRSPKDFLATLLDSVNYSRDSDTAASVACTLSGSFIGYQAICELRGGYFVQELEYREHLVQLADDLFDIAFEA